MRVGRSVTEAVRAGKAEVGPVKGGAQRMANTLQMSVQREEKTSKATERLWLGQCRRGAALH